MHTSMPTFTLMSIIMVTRNILMSTPIVMHTSICMNTSTLTIIRRMRWLMRMSIQVIMGPTITLIPAMRVKSTTTAIDEARRCPREGGPLL
jgi:hypothetical protein